MIDTTTLVDEYFELWKTTDDAQRHDLVRKIFAETAVHHAAPANVTFSGVDEIEANITRINQENIQKAGLKFRSGKSVPNHNSVQVEWEVTDPSGKKTLGTGRDLLLLDDDGRVAALYMFTGQ